MVLPTPPAIPPTLSTCADPALGLILNSLLAFVEAFKAAVQVSPPGPWLIKAALRPSSNPEFLMLPRFVVTKFDRFDPAGTGIVKIKSSVRLVYQSIDPLRRPFRRS